MSNSQNTNEQGKVVYCEDKGLPPASSGSTMPKVKPVAQQQQTPPTSKKS
jgi:hypothetical protein